MLVLLDQNAPYGLRNALPGHDVTTAYREGWDELSNGDLIKAAELAGFDVMVTCDQNIRYQQDLLERRIAFVILSSNNWNVVRTSLESIQLAVAQSVRGSFQMIEFDRPQLVRRPAKDWP